MTLASIAASTGTRTMGVAITGDSTDLSRALAKSASEVQAWESTTSASASRWSSKWKVASAGVILAIVAVAAGLTAAALSAVEFERNMRNVNSLLLVTDSELASISGSILDLAREVPQSAENLAEGLYNIASSGFEGSEALLVLESSAKAASAGLSTTDTSAKAITAVLNAYGLSAASATDVSDVLFQTVNKGVVTFDELSSVVGNFVGMTASANVPIDDASAALATMTLAGIGAAEASTSLNRLVQSLIQPSEALAATLNQLGYESGLTALQTEGLYGVMQQLGEVTNGNAEAYLRLFPEIRAARGAFALATDDGATYARLQGEIADETTRAGATQTAFAEQMQSTAAKWDILTSSMRANSIEVGQQVLPVFNSLLDIINPMANEIVPSLSAAWQFVQPQMQQVADIGADLWEVFVALYDTAEPVAEAFLKVGGALASMGLEAALSVVESLTGVLAENKTVAVALAAIYLSRFLPSLNSVIGGVVNFGKGIRYNAIWYLAEWRKAQELNNISLANSARFNGTYTQGLSRMQAGIRTATALTKTQTAAMIASGAANAALTAGLGLLVYALATAGQEMQQTVSEIQGGVDVLDISSLETTTRELEDLKASLGGVSEEGTKFDKWYEYLAPGTQFIDMFNDYRHNKDLDATYEALDEIGSKLANANLNLAQLARETGIDVTQLRSIVEAQGIDITDAVSTEGAAESRAQVKAYLDDIEKSTGVATTTMSESWELTVDEIEAFQKALEEATSAASTAFLNATDVIGSWKPNIGVEEEADAYDALAKAREHLTELERDSTASADSLKSAREGVADAEERLSEAQAKKAEGTLEAYYRNAIDTGEAFSADLAKAVEMGLDPTVVQKLLQEGPEQAGPIVQQMVADNSGALIEMVNDAEASLTELNAQIVEQARLTAIAVNSPTDELAKALPQAMEISTRAAAGATIEDIADAMGLSTSEAQAIADGFGISVVSKFVSTIDAQTVERSTVAGAIGFGTEDAAAIGSNFGTQLMTSINGAIQQQSITIPGLTVPSGGGGGSGGAPLKYAGGTPWVLPGYTPGRDVHRFYSATAGILDLSGGEGIARPELVAALGASRFQALNRAAAAGGIAGVRRALSPYLGAFANGTASLGIRAVPVPITQTNERYSPIYIGNYHGSGNSSDIDRAARKRRGFGAIGGSRKP